MKYQDKDLMEFFPLESPRGSQLAVLKEIDRAFSEGKNFIILEAPVGSGKSAIAMTVAMALGDAHLITPRKSLQNQYFDDFTDNVVLMKGRSSYPCTYKGLPGKYKSVIQHIERGNVSPPSSDEPNCGAAPCRNSQTVTRNCVEDLGPCPYSVAMDLAEKNRVVVHNLHSFIYQTSFSQKFGKRSVMIVVEAHDIEGIIREFITPKITSARVVKEEDLPNVSNTNGIGGWCEFLLSSKCAPIVSQREAARKAIDPDYRTDLDQYTDRVSMLSSSQELQEGNFTVKHDVRPGYIRPPTFEFVPHRLGNAAAKHIFSYGDKVILMSGTVYDKSLFCKNLGINGASAHFIRIPSTFPVSFRPIYLKGEYQADTSYQGWNDNFRDIIEKIESVMDIYKDAKGLIHAPSYDAAEQLANALPEDRVVTHHKGNFQEKLAEFYASEGNKVFISPICQQGVDFKGDRARFQIILRVPYPSTSDPFIRDKVEGDFQWYNYQALVVFGQQTGRINRSEDDYGATFLMDERFNRFISRNSKVLPKWLQSAIIWR